MALQRGREELASWLASNGAACSEWMASSADDDEALTLEIFGEKTQLTVPDSYPDSKEDYFFFDTESDDPRVRAVVNDAREYIFDQPPSLALHKLLDKIHKLCERGRGGHCVERICDAACADSNPSPLS